MNKAKFSMTKQTKVAVAKLSTKSAAIRYLDSQGCTRSEIASALGIRYQHVRNVLITPVKNPSK